MDTDKVLRVAANDALVIISDRVQQYGKKTDGSLIGGGKYSPGYAKKRKEADRIISHIDLTFNGDMLNDNFTVAPAGINEYEVGFRNKESGDKAEYLEAYFGEIFSMSQSEFDKNSLTIQKVVSEILR